MYKYKLETRKLNINNYQKYISEETMMGPSCIKILNELLKQCPLQFASDDNILDLGCGRGLTSLIIAKETGAGVYANDLWISADENKNRFIKWGVDRQIIPVCEDAIVFTLEKNSSVPCSA